MRSRYSGTMALFYLIGATASAMAAASSGQPCTIVRQDGSTAAGTLSSTVIAEPGSHTGTIAGTQSSVSIQAGGGQTSGSLSMPGSSAMNGTPPESLSHESCVAIHGTAGK